MRKLRLPNSELADRNPGASETASIHCVPSASCCFDRHGLRGPRPCESGLVVRNIVQPPVLARYRGPQTGWWSRCACSRGSWCRSDPSSWAASVACDRAPESGSSHPRIAPAPAAAELGGQRRRHDRRDLALPVAWLAAPPRGHLPHTVQPLLRKALAPHQNRCSELVQPSVPYEPAQDDVCEPFFLSCLVLPQRQLPREE